MRTRHEQRNGGHPRAPLPSMLIAGSMLLTLLIPAGHAGATAAGQAGRDALERRLGPGVEVAYHAGTGLVRFIGTASGEPIAQPSGVPASAGTVETARAFLARLGSTFGVADQATELRVTSVSRARAGRSVVRFRQFLDGVPVLGGELLVHLDRAGNLLSMSGEATGAPRSSDAPLVRRTDARDAARSAVAKETGVAEGRLHASRPTLWIYDSRILGGPGLGVPTLVWRTEVTRRGWQPIDELVLVDARLGSVALRFSQIEHAKNRRVCDANSTANQVPCTAPVRVEGGAASAIGDANNAYDYSGNTYDFYFTNFGRDSLDDAGMTLNSTVRFCPSPGQCPYGNAFWNGQQMVYGAGFAAADDVVGHELTHGVTEFTSHLFYYYQSGAINEAFSDIFGEYVDLTNGAGKDTAAARWLMGEDVPGLGAIRDMENPPAFGDPDSMTSANYTADTGETDSGGVHSNSGVANKAAFLLTDGATFGGQTVSGLGITKASRSSTRSRPTT